MEINSCRFTIKRLVYFSPSAGRKITILPQETATMESTMATAIKSFGVKEFSTAQSDIDRHVEEIQILGYTIVPDVVNESELVYVRRRLEEVYEQQVAEVGGAEQLRKINDSYNVRALVAYDDVFVNLASHPKILPIVERFLGSYFILMSQTGLLNVPDTGNQQNAGHWHRDLNYQHFVSSRPLAISSLLCVDRFTEQTGGTYVLPASHKSEAFPSEAFIRAHETVIEAPPGSCLVFDSMMYHRGGLNCSGNPRRAINHMYSIPFFRQQISLPKILNGKYSEDPVLRNLFGYECEQAASVLEFRAARIGRNNQSSY